MEILTLLKANIRHKKGSFVSIIILMLIVSMSFTSVISIKNNNKNSVGNALDRVNAADLTLFLESRALSGDLLDSVKNHPSVKDAAVKEAVSSLGAEFKEKVYQHPWFMVKLTDEYSLLNGDKTGYAGITPPLRSGEIYVSQGIGSALGCNIGDRITVKTSGGEREFTVKDFVVEPVFGCMNIGLKIVFVSDGDFTQLQEDALKYADEKSQTDYRMLQLYKTDKKMSDSDFKRQLNLDTGIVDYSTGSLQRAQSSYYTFLSGDLMLSGLLAFVGFLAAIVLIVMAHSISTSIEMEYTSLGILKAQGFTAGKIKAVFAVQYLTAQIIGAVLGTVLAMPLIKYLGNIFQPIMAIPIENKTSMLAGIIFVVGFLALSALFILFALRKVGKISPMKAISGGRDDVYFSNRLNAPISKKALSPSLALRQFTSNKKRYAATMLIVSILGFFMITMNVLGASVTSKSAMESMGMPFSELNLEYKKSVSDSAEKEIEDIIKQHTAVRKKYSTSNMYMSLDGDEYACVVFKNPEVMIIDEGRYPKYDNEIAVTDILSKELGLKIGDKVTVSNGKHKCECIITGFHVYANDLGLNFAMPLETAKKLGVNDIITCGYSLEDPSGCTVIADEINEKYPDIVTATAAKSDQILDLYTNSANAMTVLIYSISVLFSLVVVMMVCKKAFLQERTDIGIYKSLGFTTNKLRLQFAVRFLIVSLIGSALGISLSLIFSERALTAVFRLTGTSRFITNFSAASILIPVTLIAVSFFAFAYLASRKIKNVEIKELVTE